MFKFGTCIWRDITATLINGNARVIIIGGVATLMAMRFYFLNDIKHSLKSIIGSISKRMICHEEEVSQVLDSDSSGEDGEETD